MKERVTKEKKDASLHLRLTKSEKKWLKKQSKDRGLSISRLVFESLRRYIE